MQSLAGKMTDFALKCATKMTTWFLLQCHMKEMCFCVMMRV